MNDVAINQVSSLLNAKPGKIVPVYMISVFSEDRESVKRFISTNYEEFSFGVRFSGFFAGEKEDKIKKNYEKLLQSTNKDLYCQYLIPWNQIYSIQNLIYKQK